MRTHAIRLALAVILLSPFVSAQWKEVGLTGRGVAEIAAGSSWLFAVTSDSGSVYRSTDGGTNWMQIVPSLGTHVAVAPNGTTFMTVGDSLYRSTDGGASWNNLRMLEQLSGAFPHGILCVAVGPYGTVYSGTTNSVLSGDGGKGSETIIAVSTDNGGTWTMRGLDGGMAYSIREHSALTYGGFSTVTTGGVYHSFSFNDGLTWSSVYDNTRDFFSPPFTWCANGNIIGKGRFVPGTSGLGLSVDTCASLTKVSDKSPSALLALPQGGVLVGMDTTGIYLFSDNGDSLGTRNEGLTDLHIHTFAMDSVGYVLVGTNKGAWRRPLSELITSVYPLTGEQPHEFVLHQNYPNPFNPSTTIRYELPKSANVRLSVYDMLGREVSVLVNERRDAGVHEVKFDAAGLSSGVYFYRMQAGDFTHTKRLLLLK
jgi:hypothetical protein